MRVKISEKNSNAVKKDLLNFRNTVGIFTKMLERFFFIIITIFLETTETRILF